MKRIALNLVFLLTVPFMLHAQHFRNSSLEGTPTDDMSELPPDWESVPVDDPACQASEDTYASPDLVSHDLPDPEWWLNGDPHSGKTFMSGVKDGNGSSFEHDEGIMQHVTGFIPGNRYTLNFFQCVHREMNQLAHVGAWKVYVDGKLIGTSDFSRSNRSNNTNKLDWVERNVSFNATSTEHTIKFLPEQEHPSTSDDNDYALRMGIDDITIEAGDPLPLSIITGPVLHSIVVNNQDSAAVQLDIFLGENTKPEKGQTIPVGNSEVDLSALPSGQYKLRFSSTAKMITFDYQVE